MSKKSNAKRVIGYLDCYGIKYQVLSKGSCYPVHIRYNGIDIWPSTGTYCIGGKTVKRNIERLMSMLKTLPSSEKPQPKQQTSSDATQRPKAANQQCACKDGRVRLEKRLLELESRLIDLERYIDQPLAYSKD